MIKLNDFPQSAQQQILRYLEVKNFRAAKELYDYFLLENFNTFKSK